MVVSKKKRRALENKKKKKLAGSMEQVLQMPAIDGLIKGMALMNELSLSSSSAAAAASKSLSSSSSTSTASKTKTTGLCYHGSLAKHFVKGSEYLQTAKAYVLIRKKNLEFGNEAVAKAEAFFFNEMIEEEVKVSSEFVTFLFALAVSLYFQVSHEEKAREEEEYRSKAKTWNLGSVMFEVRGVIFLALRIKYWYIPHERTKGCGDDKFLKFIRDIDTERGVILCLAREIKPYCTCMVTKKKEAKDMPKLESCMQCSKYFLKKNMKKCNGCNAVVYCSKECATLNWPFHHKVCKAYQELKPNGINLDDDDDDDDDDDSIECSMEKNEEITALASVEAARRCLEKDDDDFDALVQILDDLRKNQNATNRRLMQPIDETVEEMRIALEEMNKGNTNNNTITGTKTTKQQQGALKEPPIERTDVAVAINGTEVIESAELATVAPTNTTTPTSTNTTDLAETVELKSAPIMTTKKLHSISVEKNQKESSYPSTDGIGIGSQNDEVT